MRWFAAACGILTAANFHLQALKTSTELRLEEKIENLSPLRLGIVGKQS
jgi:hypothetical protein